MKISAAYSLAIIAVTAVCSLSERWLPFILFHGREIPSWLRYVGRMLPLAVMTTLIFYCLRNTSFSAPALWAPQLIAVAVTAVLHLLLRRTLLSLVGGTACYMLLIQLVFC